jgi:hypothetical protein
MDLPAGYLVFSTEEPKGCIDVSRVQGVCVGLVKPILDWPKDLYEEYQQDLYFLFPKLFKSESYNTRDMVCLCATVKNCPKKPGMMENRACSEYRRGLCIQASMEANNCEPLALGSIARFHGLSKQRVHQIYNHARKKLILDLSQDAVVQEYLADVFIGKRNIPTPGEIAQFIEKALQQGG